MKDWHVTIAGFLLIQAFVGLMFLYLDKKAWNNGICAKSGKPWRRLYYEVGRVYEDGCGNTIHLSWGVDK